MLLDHPLLRAGPAVVDRPGVGGLDVHGRITLGRWPGPTLCCSSPTRPAHCRSQSCTSWSGQPFGSTPSSSLSPRPTAIGAGARGTGPRPRAGGDPRAAVRRSAARACDRPSQGGGDGLAAGGNPRSGVAARGRAADTGWDAPPVAAAAAAVHRRVGRQRPRAVRRPNQPRPRVDHRAPLRRRSRGVATPSPASGRAAVDTRFRGCGPAFALRSTPPTRMPPGAATARAPTPALGRSGVKPTSAPPPRSSKSNWRRHSNWPEPTPAPTSTRSGRGAADHPLQRSEATAALGARKWTARRCDQ